MAKKVLQAESKLMKCITTIIPMSRKITQGIHELTTNIKKKRQDFKGISSNSLIHRLLRLNTNIYKEIKSQIAAMDGYLNDIFDTNLLINIMFDLANEYIKYDLQMIVYICDFLYSDDLEICSFKKQYEYFKESILKRLKAFDFGQDPIKKTLIDIGVPANNVKKVFFLVKNEFENQPINYSSVLDALKRS